MKISCKAMMVVALSVGLTQVAVAETIKIAKENSLTYKSPWTYKILTREKKSSNQVESKPQKFNKKNAIITFDDAHNDEVIVQVLTGFSENRIVLKRGQALYKNKGILVDHDGKVSLINKDEAPFAPTKSVSVEKQNSDGKRWEIIAENPRPSLNDQYFEYGNVNIKNSTNPGKGLVVPKNKAFELHVQKQPGVSEFISTDFTAEDARNLKKIIIDKDGKAKPA